jgi:hypothetical protein
MSSTTKKFPILAVTCGILVFAVICVCAGVAWHLLQPRETIIDAPGDQPKIDAHGALIESLSLLSLSNSDEEGSPTSGLSTTQLALFALVTLVIIGIGVLYHRRIHLPAHRMRRENAQAARDQAARQESFLLQLMESQGQGRPTPN